MDTSSSNIPPQNNSKLETIKNAVKTISMKSLYILGLIIYCICIIILFTRNPYDIITGNASHLFFSFRSINKIDTSNS